jgi:hypothetical protein
MMHPRRKIMKYIILSLVSVMAISFGLSAAADAPPVVNAPVVNAPVANGPVMAPAVIPPSINSPAPQNAMTGDGNMGGSGDHPCKRIAEACKAAGYVRGDKTGKDMMQCMGTIMHGGTLTNVSVNPSDVAACKQKHANRMKQQSPM